MKGNAEVIKVLNEVLRGDGATSNGAPVVS
jgi:hypothetical protein